ncbi:MAG: Archaeal ATPase [Pelotomaculum sp. PtaB.Bin013]|uniref:AAA family ATPase n=1 Tax=Pelotomaculum isophthalicicum JI TaxID=947010 RepID=A0A9X4H2V7_9FIRM|nr:ATP-binding protein [Pelotomaculum isophthalicicum]MDF9408671.1 AAA family ATPase [Pelotomaculum isophthalicicum JI]OPX83255.1 MAG: Archaeal ATPase [Pelotomaculum sp. PtaB.Bin013]
MLFPLGGPVPESELVGRKDFIMSLETRLSEGQSIMLAGPRRIGKTSVANEVSRRLKKKGFYVASVDFFRTSNNRSIAEAIINSCLENRTGVRKTLNAVWDRARLLAGAAKIAVKVEDLELNLGFPKREMDDETLLEYALNLPDVLASKDNKRMLMVFDEFQDAGHVAGQDIYKKMRSYFQLQTNVSYLFLGSKEGMMQSLFGGKKHAFYRFATVLPIPRISEESWTVYIGRKFEEKGVKISSDYALKEIGRLSGGHPQDTMLISNEAYYTLLEAGEKKLTMEIVRIAYERAMVILTPVFDEILDEVGKKSIVREVLHRLAVGDAIYMEKKHPNDIKRAIDQLIVSAVIKKESRGKYRFVEPMLQEYVLRSY